MTYGTLPPVAYPPTAKLLHWLIAISLLVQAPLGLVIVHVELGAWQNASFNFHKSLGVLILLLMLWRVVNRFSVGPVQRRTWHALCVADRAADHRLSRQLRFRRFDTVLRFVRDTRGHWRGRRVGEPPVCCARLGRTGPARSGCRARRSRAAALLHPQRRRAPTHAAEAPRRT